VLISVVRKLRIAQHFWITRLRSSYKPLKQSLTLQNLPKGLMDYLSHANFFMGDGHSLHRKSTKQWSNQLTYPPTHWSDEMQTSCNHTWVKYFPLGERTFKDRSRINLKKSHKEPAGNCDNIIRWNFTIKQRLRVTFKL